MSAASFLIAVVITGWISRLLPMSRLSLWGGMVLAAGLVLGLLLLSFDGLNLVGYLQGGFGEFSAGTCIVACSLLLERVSGQNWISAKERVLFYRVVLLLGLSLYPMSLGLSYFDPYVLGYYPTVLSVVCLAIAVVGVWKANRLLVIWLLLAGLMFKFELLESVNLWDYLLDPWIFIYSFFVVLPKIGSSVD